MFAVWCELDPPVGYRAEIAEGAIRMNPLPASAHALIASILDEALVRSRLRSLKVFQAVRYQARRPRAVVHPRPRRRPAGGAVRSEPPRSGRRQACRRDHVAEQRPRRPRGEARRLRRQWRCRCTCSSTGSVHIPPSRCTPSLSTAPTDDVVTVPFGERSTYRPRSTSSSTRRSSRVDRHARRRRRSRRGGRGDRAAARRPRGPARRQGRRFPATSAAATG